MATGRPALSVPVSEIAAALLGVPEVGPRAQVIADRVCEMLPESAAVVYIIEDSDSPVWNPRAVAGDIQSASTVEFESGILGELAATRTLQLFDSARLQREDISHLDIRRTAVSLACVPLVFGETLVGAVEVLGFDRPFDKPALQLLNAIAELAAPAIAAALNYEKERNASLQSISRVTQMYDLEKVFNSTLELNDLLQMIAKKFAEVLSVQSINLWMVNGDAVELISQEGYDETASVGALQQPGKGVAGDISDNGEPVLIDDAQDERLQKRNARSENAPVFSLVAAPLMEAGNLVGVVEAVNRADGLPFDDDDLFLLVNMCETASNALHNAELLKAERKVEVLEALVKVSGEITSTLDLDRVLQAIVNEPGAVIHYDRAALALENRGRLQIRAVTGMVTINAKDPEIARLQDMLEWASISSTPMLVRQHGETIDTDREETLAKFRTYFNQSGMRGFHYLPLVDDDGRIGALAFESSDPDFLTVAHMEMIKVLAGQATVALRNASLYREVPFIDFIEPIMARKRKFLAMEKQRRLLLIAFSACVLVFLAAFPLQLRVDGPAVVAPIHTARVQPEVAGIVEKVFVREGDAVRQGSEIAKIDDREARIALASAQAKYGAAVSAMDRSLSTNDGTQAGIQRVEADYWKSEVERARERLEQTILRSPIDGRVATPHIEDFTGRSLNPGDTFAEVVDTSHANVDVAIDEVDLTRVKPGQKAAIKLEGLPNRTFRAPVTLVSPKAELVGSERFFFARVLVPNDEGLLRSGMQGRGKVSTGWEAAGWVIFRRPAVWAWSKLWSWIGW